MNNVKVQKNKYENKKSIRVGNNDIKKREIKRIVKDL